MPTPSRGTFRLHQRESLARCLQQFALKRFTAMLIREQQSEEQGDTLLPCLDGTSLHLSLTFRKKEKIATKTQLLSDVQPVRLPVSGVYFLKYLCLISASVTCRVQYAADTFWQRREASGQHRRAQATL